MYSGGGWRPGRLAYTPGRARDKLVEILLTFQSSGVSGASAIYSPPWPLHPCFLVCGLLIRCWFWAGYTLEATDTIALDCARKNHLHLPQRCLLLSGSWSTPLSWRMPMLWSIYGARRWRFFLVPRTFQMGAPPLNLNACFLYVVAKSRATFPPLLDSKILGWVAFTRLW